MLDCHAHQIALLVEVHVDVFADLFCVSYHIVSKFAERSIRIRKIFHPHGWFYLNARESSSTHGRAGRHVRGTNLRLTALLLRRVRLSRMLDLGLRYERILLRMPDRVQSQVYVEGRPVKMIRPLAFDV